MTSTMPSSSFNVAGSADSSTLRRNSKRPKYSKFTQQELPACKPVLTQGWVIAVFMFVAIIFIPIGIVSLHASQNVVEIVYPYDNSCIPPAERSDKIKFIQSSANKTCNFSLNVIKDMKQPIYVYYQLDNFYQNHRRYVKSRNDKQLRYNSSVASTKGCSPEAKSKDRSHIIVPCGLIAWSMFNDTYNFSINNKQLIVNKDDIAWKSDKWHKFGSNVKPQNFQSGSIVGGAHLDSSIPLSEQQDLIVWMRTAALPTFRKLYGKIKKDINAHQQINVTLQNNYNTYSFSGKKTLVLSTTSWLGGKNDFLGFAYIGVGGLCFLLAMSFSVAYFVKPRQLGDPSYLSWNKSRTGH